MPEPQQPVIDFLTNPASYGLPPDARIERIDTHGASVFLAGRRAFKLKRAIRFSYLDFSTVALREKSCRIELAVNRRTAPGIYLAIHKIARAADGRLSFDGSGEALDWVIEMRRFDQSLLFDRMAGDGRLTLPLMQELADVIWDFHQSLTPAETAQGAARLARVTEGNQSELEAAVADGILDATKIHRANERSQDALRSLAALLDDRARRGMIRRGHGDLHLRNICLWEGRPTLFDAIEFSEELATIDRLYDLAFLLMDLEHRGAKAFSNRVFNRYLDRGEEEEGRAALPLFMATRALIRSHVSASTARRQEQGGKAQTSRDESRRYLDLALRLLQPATPSLIAVGGLSGTGKSTLAYHLAPSLGTAPGARVLRSDVIRKRLWGVAPEARLPDEAYRPEASQAVYASLGEAVARALRAGGVVIADAVFARPEERAAIEAVARVAGVGFIGFWLEAPATLLERRIGERRGDASDATVAVLREQQHYDTGPLAWARIDTSGSLERTADRIRHDVKQALHTNGHDQDMMAGSSQAGRAGGKVAPA
jgi:aminoglycoside phosphotransferase family enzyme/predicted kinase